MTLSTMRGRLQQLLPDAYIQEFDYGRCVTVRFVHPLFDLSLGVDDRYETILRLVVPNGDPLGDPIYLDDLEYIDVIRFPTVEAVADAFNNIQGDLDEFTWDDMEKILEEIRNGNEEYRDEDSYRRLAEVMRHRRYELQGAGWVPPPYGDEPPPSYGDEPPPSYQE